VLSPYLFAVFIDSVVQRVQASGTGCYVKFTCVCIIVYTEDILLLAPSVAALQQLLYACEVELDLLDMTINVNKSACMRIGPWYKVICRPKCLTTVDGREILWCDTGKYLCVYLTAATVFRCTSDFVKRSFFIEPLTVYLKKLAVLPQRRWAYSYWKRNAYRYCSMVYIHALSGYQRRTMNDGIFVIQLLTTFLNFVDDRQSWRWTFSICVEMFLCTSRRYILNTDSSFNVRSLIRSQF